MPDQSDRPNEAEPELSGDLELTDVEADEVRGGDAATLSNVLKAKHDASQGTISNMR